MDELVAEAASGTDVSPLDYANLLYTVLAGEVRETEAAHPLIAIRGTLEARVQGAELVVLGGLNDGTWPAPTKPDSESGVSRMRSGPNSSSMPRLTAKQPP